jgi:hypothetical protein
MSDNWLKEGKKIIYGGIVQKGADDIMIGRIRVFPDHENVQQILNSYKGKVIQNKNVLNDNETDISENFYFTDNDPFAFLPLLPLNFNYIPKEGEYVNLIYSNADYNQGRKDQFYIPGPKSTPRNLEKETNVITRSVFSEGSNIAPQPSIKNKNGEYKNVLSKGVFAEPGDIGLYSQGRSDIILKDDEVLIRSMKTKTLYQDTEPEVYEKRSFIQLSNFNRSSKQEPVKKYTEPKQIKTFLSKLIEYDIINIDNPLRIFTGSVSIYNVPGIALTDVTTFNENTELPEQYMSPIFRVNFQGENAIRVIEIINGVIRGLNDGSFTVSGTTEISYQQPEDSSQFPYYFRPSKALRSLKQGIDDIVSLTNLTGLRIAVGLFNSAGAGITSSLLSGSGLISGKDTVGLPLEITTTYESPISRQNTRVGYSVIGSEYVYLLSHNTVIPNKKPVVLDSTTVYGIDEEKLSIDYKARTEGLVRSGSLKQLLNLIIQFLISHGHPYHQLPPIPQGVDKILQEFGQYDTKVVNQNIRIN